MADRGIKGVKTVAASKLDIRAPVMNVETNSGINFHSAVLLPPPAYPLRCLSAAIKLRRARARLLRSFLLSRGFLFLFSFPPPQSPHPTDDNDTDADEWGFPRRTQPREICFCWLRGISQDQRAVCLVLIMGPLRNSRAAMRKK
jgi:hypothetical protein